MLTPQRITQLNQALREELDDSMIVKKKMTAALAALPTLPLPKGAIVKKTIKGHIYYYLLFRENGKVKTRYIGKNVPSSMRDKYKQTRLTYQLALSKLNRKIMYLKKAIEAVTGLSSNI